MGFPPKDARVLTHITVRVARAHRRWLRREALRNASNVSEEVRQALDDRMAKLAAERKAAPRETDADDNRHDPLDQP